MYREGLHNNYTIYYHCNSDNALLLSFLLTCHPYIPFHLAFHSGGKSRIVTILSTKVLIVKRHIACPNRTNLCENYGP